MNIAFDALAILGPFSKNRGIGNYSLAQFRKMIEMDKDNKYYFFNLIEDFSMQNVVSSGCVTDCYFFTGDKNELYVNEEYSDVIGAIVKKFLKKNDIDVFYVTSPFQGGYLLYRREWFENVKVIATVYDIIPYVFKDKYLPDKSSYEFYMTCLDNLRWMDEYLVISNSVKNDMIKYLDFPAEKIHVIYGAVDEELYRQMEINVDEKTTLYRKYDIIGDFIMCTGGDDYRKNIAGLIGAYAKMKKELIQKYQLVIVCKLSVQAVERYTNLSNELGISGRVILTNFVTNEELIQLYNCATLMAFPSIYEGFGLPIVEAWRCGTPVLTSDNSSLGEIAGDGAILVDPYSENSITDGLNKALGETDMEALLVKGQERMKLFTWDKVAQASIDVINNLGKCDDIAKKAVKKIAMFTPLPPMQSGISDYSVDVIKELSKYFDIDVYIDDYKPDGFKIDNVQIMSVNKFKKNYELYDRIIYQVGNSLFHEYMFPYIKKYQGIVTLHDYNLRDVLEVIYLYKNNLPKQFLKKLLEDLTEEAANDYMNNLDKKQYLQKYELNGFVTNYASRVIVHSEYAKRKLLEKNIAYNVEVIPLYTLIDDNNLDNQKVKSELGIAEGKKIFAAFGHVHTTKRAVPILKAVQKVKTEFTDFHFYFVGKLDESVKEEFECALTEYNLRDFVTVTGYTTLDDFQRYMDVADVCLNLRYPYNGESSASFMRLLGKGKCTIVNKIGSFAEVPEDACIMIDNVKDMTTSQEIDAIYDAMKTACNDEVRKGISVRASEYAKRELAISIIIEKYRKVIEKKDAPCVLNEKLLQTCAKSFSTNEFRKLSKTLAYILKSTNE
ncbi:MAG: glycosyltransferase [Clostridium sp.]|nr:glycosyltransferase [Clostridium sp.]